MNSIPISKLNDVITTMEQKAGLLVDYNKLSNTKPETIVRCPTISHPKKPNGFYIIKESNFCITIIYINHEFGEKLKYVIKLSNDKNYINSWKSSLNSYFKIQSIPQSLVEKNKQHINYYNHLPPCLSHPYIDKKGLVMLNCYELKQDNNKLCIPFYNKDIQLCGYQTITVDGEKRFKGSYGDCFYQYPLHNPDPIYFKDNHSFILIGEGFATVMSAKEAIEDYFGAKRFMCYAIVAFSVSNLDSVIKATKHRKLPYILLVDNDLTKPINAGIENAWKLLHNNPNEAIYAVVPSNYKDANDFILDKGGDEFIGLLIKETPIWDFIGGIKNYE